MITRFVIAFVVLFATSGCAVGRGLQYAGVTVDHNGGDLARQFGFGGAQMSVTNNTAFWCDLYVYGRHIDKMLGPSDNIFDPRRYEPHNPQVPVMVRCFEDPDATRYVGAAMRILYPGPNSNITGRHWTIAASELQRIEGGAVSRASCKPAVYPLDPERRSFPRRYDPLFLQILNNTPWKGVVRRNNQQDTALFGPADVTAYNVDEFYGTRPKDTYIEILFFDGSKRFMGTWRRNFTAYSKQPLSVPIIIRPGDIDRAGP